MWENGISRFSCHFARKKVFLGVKKYIPRIRIQLPFHQGTETHRFLNRSSKEVTKKITYLRGKCYFCIIKGKLLCVFLHFRATFQLSPTFLRQKCCADYKNHIHFLKICTVFKISEELGIPDFGGKTGFPVFRVIFFYTKYVSM